MAYIVNQYNHNRDSSSDFITLITQGTAKTRTHSIDMGISGEMESEYLDPCVQVTQNLDLTNHYYFKCQIKRLETEQKFYIKLCNYDDTLEVNYPSQYIKTIIVKPIEGDSKWADVEFIFTPVNNDYNCILFQFQRTSADVDDPRVPIIAYRELGVINNIINSKFSTNDKDLLKIGVQSRPGFMLCINGEEIHLSRTGIYEIKSGVIPIKFFSAVTAAEGTKTPPTYDPDNPQSYCDFGNAGDTTIESFILDYMYKD